jgi:hypothetical protein
MVNGVLFSYGVASTKTYIDVSGSTFQLSGNTTTSIYLIYLLIGSVFMGDNIVFDTSNNNNSGSTLTSVLFIGFTSTTSAASKIYLANSYIDFSLTTSTAGLINLNQGATLVAPGATFVATSTAAVKIIVVAASGFANLLNCTFRTGTSTVPVTSNGKVDISPLILQQTLTTTGTASFGLTYNDTNFSVSICPTNGTTATAAPYITAVTTTGASYAVAPAGGYTITVTKTQSTIT